MAEAPQSKISDHTAKLTLTPHTTIHIRVQDLDKSLVVYLTTATHETSSTSSALGSFVYALPNRLDPASPLSTALVTVADSVEFATRAAKILAKRLGKPVYVGNSINLSWGPAGAGVPEVGEEVEALRKVVDVVCKATAKGELNGS